MNSSLLFLFTRMEPSPPKGGVTTEVWEVAARGGGARTQGPRETEEEEEKGEEEEEEEGWRIRVTRCPGAS